MGKVTIKLCLIGSLVIMLLVLTGCMPREEIDTKAVLLAPENDGQLPNEDIEKYPEVIKVTSFNDFKNTVSKDMAIWIDKDTVDLLDLNWLRDEAQDQVPIVLIGYNDALYSFRDILSCFDIEGPYVDWKEKELEPGFSVGMLKGKTDQSQSIFLEGYDGVPDTNQILLITNELLEETPSI